MAARKSVRETSPITRCLTRLTFSDNFGHSKCVISARFVQTSRFAFSLLTRSLPFRKRQLEMFAYTVQTWLYQKNVPISAQRVGNGSRFAEDDLCPERLNCS